MSGKSFVRLGNKKYLKDNWQKIGSYYFGVKFKIFCCFTYILYFEKFLSLIF